MPITLAVIIIEVGPLSVVIRNYWYMLKRGQSENEYF